MRTALSHILFLLFALPVSAQPMVSKGNFHLYLLAGQSNMAGRARVEGEDTVTNNRIWMLNKAGNWQAAKEPLHFDKPEVVGVGPGFAFAKAMAASDTTIVIGLIPCAVGGSSITVWEPGTYYEPTKSYPYDDAVRRTKLAMQAGTLKGILWQQGESDNDSVNATAYPGRLTALVKRFRNEFKLNNLPFVAGTISAFYVDGHPWVKEVNKGIEALPEAMKNTAAVPADGLTDKGDKTHFDGASARELGKRYAQVFLKQFTNNKPKF